MDKRARSGARRPGTRGCARRIRARSVPAGPGGAGGGAVPPRDGAVVTDVRRGRGRRDNGLDAALWSPLRDVDPRVGEPLLDVPHAAGIAASLEPSADVAPYPRTVYLPSPPSDRLFVDRARRAEARSLVDGQVDELARGPAQPERARLRRDLDEDAEWARIVAAFEAEHGRTVVEDAPPPPPPPPPPAPPPR